MKTTRESSTTNHIASALSTKKTMSRIDHSGPHTFLEVWHEEMARAESRAKKDPGIEPGQVGGTKSRHTSGQNLNVISNCSSGKQMPQQRDLNNRCEEARSILICTIVPKSEGRGISFALFTLLVTFPKKQVLWGQVKQGVFFGGGRCFQNPILVQGT